MRLWVTGPAAAVLGVSGASADAADVRACGTSLAVAGDTESFAAAGRDAGPERIGRLAAEIAALFQEQAALLCEQGFLGAQDFVGVETLQVVNAEGAAEPNLTRPGSPAKTLRFEFAFGDGGAPQAEAVAAALRCWRRPDLDDCSLD